MYNHADKAHNDIEKNGCHIIHDEGNESRPPMTYSIGIAKTEKRPDIIITGMEKDTAHFLINEYLYRIKDGEVFEAGVFYKEFLEDIDITYKIVDPQFYNSHAPYTKWFYKHDDFTMLHFIWPDIDGTWPWDKTASKDYRWLMPKLYKD